MRALLEERDPTRPFFLFVNYIEAHGPYAPPEPYRSQFLSPGRAPTLVATALRRRGPADHYLGDGAISPEEFEVLNELYDGEVAYVDALVGELVAELERQDVLSESVLLVTSDHGENIGHNGHFRHIFSLYDGTLRVPLIAVLPDGSRAGEVATEPVSLRDLFATVLARFGIEQETSGRDVLEGRDAAEPLFAEYYYPLQAFEAFPPKLLADRPEVLGPWRRRLRAVESDGWKLVWGSDGRHELFDLGADPNEATNLAGAAGVALRERTLADRLARFVEAAGGDAPLPVAAGAPPLDPGLDDESRARLRELGYLR